MVEHFSMYNFYLPANLYFTYERTLMSVNIGMQQKNANKNFLQQKLRFIDKKVVIFFIKKPVCCRHYILMRLIE